MEANKIVQAVIMQLIVTCWIFMLHSGFSGLFLNHYGFAQVETLIINFVFIFGTPFLVWYSFRDIFNHKALRISLISSSIIWFSNPVLFWDPLKQIIYYPQFSVALELLDAFTKRSQTLSLVDCLFLILFIVAFIVGAYGIGGLSSFVRTSASTREAVRDDGASKTAQLHAATWASKDDIKHKFNSDGGIVLGEHTDPIYSSPDFLSSSAKTWKSQGKGQLITINPKDGNGHVLVTAAPSGFKTTGIVIPNILTYKGPIVVLDPKGDLYARTHEARRAMGFNPIVVDANNGLDPFKLLAPLIKKKPSTFFTLAKTIVPKGPNSNANSEFFYEMSVALFAALIGHFHTQGVDNISGAITEFLSMGRVKVIAAGIKIGQESEHEFIRNRLVTLGDLDDRTYPGVINGITNKLNFQEFADVAAFVASKSDATIYSDVLAPNADIYLNIPTTIIRDFTPMVRLLLASFFVSAKLTEQPERPSARRLFLLDEARALGGMDILKDVRDQGRDIGLHLMMIYQTFGQVIECWGESGAEAWMDACEAKIFGAVQSERRSREITNMLGKHTVSTTTHTSSRSNKYFQPLDGQAGHSTNEQLKEIPLLSQSMLGQLPKHGSVIFTSSSKPILASKAIYFTRPKMAPQVKSYEDVSGELALIRPEDAIIAPEDLIFDNPVVANQENINPKTKAYDPNKNGRFIKPSTLPYESAEWEHPSEISRFPTQYPNHLLFDHFESIRIPNIFGETDQGAEITQDKLQDLIKSLKPVFGQTGVVSAIKKHRLPLSRSKAVQLFLNAYPTIPTDRAFVMRALWLGANLPYKLWPSCVWEDTVGAEKRLFRQPVTIDGYPLGAAQSWPINEWNDDTL
jgi:type IV secretion system protein VirD4